MEAFGSFGLSGIRIAAKKKRSVASRRPRSEKSNFSDYPDISYVSSTPPSDSVSKVSSDENIGYDLSSYRKEISLSQCITKDSYVNTGEARLGGSFKRVKRYSEGVLAPSRDIHSLEGNEESKKPNRMKLKFDGVTRAMHAISSSNSASVGGSSSSKSSRASEASRSRQKLILQENSDEDDSPQLNIRKVDSLRGRISKDRDSLKHKDQFEPLRKSTRAPKRRRGNGILDDSDDEIRYLESLKTSNLNVDYGSKFEEDNEEGSKKQRNISMVLKKHESNDDGQYSIDVGVRGSRSVKDSKKRSRTGKSSKDIDYNDDEELGSDNDLETERKKPRKEIMAVTTRQRARRNGKDATSTSGASLIEFPNGLPPAPPRKQKEILTEVEQQLRKVEAAQKRKIQVEKAARELEAEAIKKILGQDSSRKKREDKIKKRQEELTQEKAANALTLAANSVRWVLGPKGTVVTFSNDIGLPSIFEPKPCSYPPPRGKCAGPACMNPYKYRDSKSKLPLCSLQCYKALHENTQQVTPC